MERFASVACFVVLAGCGANVVFGEDGSNGGGGDGAGASGAGSPGGAPTTSSGPGPTTDTGGTGGVTTTFMQVTTTSSVGGAAPEFACALGEPGVGCQDCAGEAQFRQCERANNACENEGDACFGYAECIFNCGGQPDCCAQCVNQTEVGAKLYTDLVFCVVCQACPQECAGVLPGLCE